MSKKIDVNKYDEMKNQSDYWEIEFNKKDLECAELKHQLAERDKEIQEWKDGTMIVKYEHQLAEKDKLLEAKESVNKMYKATLELKDGDFNDLIEEIKELKQQLAEKDKECEGHYKNFVDQLQKTFDLEKQLKDQHHQICTLIRSRAREIHQIDGGYYYVISKSVLDQIEKGE